MLPISLEAEIDRLVYGLTAAEVAIVEAGREHLNEFFAIFVKSTFQNMDTLTIELRHEKAFDLLKDLESMEIIRLVETVEPIPQGVRLGSLVGRYSLPDDFNAPLDDLEDYQ